MADDLDDDARRIRIGLANVCLNIDSIRAALRAEYGHDDPLERVLASARSGGDVTGPLDFLHAVLQAGGDVHGVYDGSTRGLRLAGADSSRPDETVYLCPDRRCSRYAWPTINSAAPTCSLSGTSLRRDRLGP